MHLLFYSHSILDTRGLSTLVSVAVVLGGIYGTVELVYKSVRWVGRTFRQERRSEHNSW